MELDPQVMRHLGGPTPREKLAGVTARRARSPEIGDWYFKIVADSGEAAGTIGIWATEWNGEKTGYNAGTVPSNDWVIELWPR